VKFIPLGPFFCAQEGRYLPGLTDLIVLAAAALQRAEIEEQLLKLRLKQKCFVALAQACPEPTVLSPPSKKVSIKVFPGAPGIGDGFKSDASSALLNCSRAPQQARSFETSGPGAPGSVFNAYPKGRWT
jgi:hypothetical protein